MRPTSLNLLIVLFVRSSGLQQRQSCGKFQQPAAPAPAQPKATHQQAGLSSPNFTRSTFLVSLLATPTVAYAAVKKESDQFGGESSISSSPPTISQPEGISSSRRAFEESISGFIAGGTLTVTKTLVKYPLDTATVRLQMPNSPYSLSAPWALMDGSYRGVISPLLGNIPAGAIFFAVKDAVKASLRNSSASGSTNRSTQDLPRWAVTMIAVAVAQFPYWLVRNPSEVVKTRQQAGTAGYGDGVSSLDAYRRVRDDTIAKQQQAGQDSDKPSLGLSGFYTGYWENILYAYPADVIKFVVYDAITRGAKHLPPAEGALAGAIATATAQFITTPLDVVRNRIMVDNSIDKAPRREQQQSNESPSYVSSSIGAYGQNLVKLGKEEGIPGLFAGWSPRIGKAFLSGAIQFATYEETKQEIGKLFERR